MDSLDPMTRTLLATLAALLALAAPASAAKTTFTIKGAGFGHGVGMSQYGAMGYATHGWNAAQILGHYYTGTTLGTTDPTEKLRIRLVEETSSRADQRRAAGGLAQARPHDDLHRQAPRHLRRWSSPRGGKRVATFTAPLQVAGAQRRRRAERQGLLPRDARVQADGLQGPVGDQRGRAGRLPARASSRPSRRPRGRPRRCARRRSRRARTRSRPPRAPTSTTSRTPARRSTAASSVEQASTNAAVADTRGQIVTYQGQPVVTYFFSTSGGKTESVENTTLGNEPQAVAGVGRRRVRRRLAAPSLDDAADDGVGGEEARLARRQGAFHGHPGAQARRVAADHRRRGRRLAAARRRSTARRCGRSSGCSTRGRTSRRSRGTDGATRPAAPRRRARSRWPRARRWACCAGP